jgi:hypothetical protein
MWCDDVFLHIQAVSPQYLKKYREARDHTSERQLCVDALFQLIQVTPDPIKK